jgi:hypothetical protein
MRASGLVRPNWQTRQTQNQVVETSCWFESGQGHHSDWQVLSMILEPARATTALNPKGLADAPDEISDNFNNVSISQVVANNCHFKCLTH